MAGMTQFARAIWRRAALEEEMDIPSVSEYGQQTLKFPRSWVERVHVLNHSKSRNYNFIGRLAQHERQWAEDFAHANFTAADYWEFSEKPGWWKQPIGPFDHTGLREHWVPQRAAKDADFDEEYYRVIASSNFTLCPRGDKPYSLRFLDSIMGGSIPVVRSLEKDLDSPFSTMTSVPYHHYALEDGTPLVYREDWVEENMHLFVKYNTFIWGDNVPEGWTPPLGMKEALEIGKGNLSATKQAPEKRRGVARAAAL